MRIRKIILVCLTMVLGLTIITACEATIDDNKEEKYVTELQVSGVQGIVLKGTELELTYKLIYSDGTTSEQLPVTSEMLTNYDKDKSGEANITITKEGKTFEFGILVADKIVETTEELELALLEQEDGEVIYLRNGNYDLQVKIKKQITLFGESKTGVVIATTDYENLEKMQKIGAETADYYGLVVVTDTDATLKNLTVKGDMELATANNIRGNRYVGVVVISAGITMDNVAISEIRYEDNLFGIQDGFGFYAVTENEDDKIVIRNSNFEGFQKCAIIVRSNFDLTVENTTIVGIGPQERIAQNGIQSASKCTIKDNNISGLSYTGGEVSSSGLLFVGVQETDVVLENNTFTVVDKDVSFI